MKEISFQSKKQSRLDENSRNKKTNESSLGTKFFVQSEIAENLSAN